MGSEMCIRDSIRDVEKHRPENEIILYDCNRGWTRWQALQVMQATSDLCVTFEQPCETLDDIAAIRPLHSAAVSVDETLVTLQDGARIARDGLAEVFGIKLNRVGGLTKAARLRDIALAHGIDIFVMATGCLLYTSPSPRDLSTSRMPSSA